ncbi:solute carrier family 2 member 11, like [Megalops cyprinoides]|uniref:solute carrier family 2 member 11, like n=1 Tax=Megalops cyprinoides TaxID=118141 RepID=UPI001863B087|nr:solute carrier family 2 member 11, like [Megalops cyprinoides]
MSFFSMQSESPRLIAAMLVTGIGGTFQYGFHISVLNSPSSFIKELVNSTCLQRYGYSLEPWEMTIIWSFIHSIFCIGGLLGSLCAGWLALAYGRKRCLLLNNVVAIISAVLMLLSKTAMSFEMILVGRLLYGINAGVSLTVHTMYMVECAPKRLRGLVGVSVASFVSMGKFCGQLMGLRELLGTEERWPWLLAFNGLTGLIQLLSLPFLPESPRYLLLDRGDRQGCERAINQLWGKKSHDSEINDMLKEHAAIRGVRSCSVVELFLKREERWQLLTVLVTFVTLQLCGINAVYLYSLDVFHAAGIPAEQVRYAALGTGLCEVTTSLACIMMIESTGKRVLFFRGYMGMATILGLLTITLNLQGQFFWMPYCSMVLIFLFIFFFSSGPAGVTASLPGDIFMQSSKPAAFTIACCLNWTGLFLIGMVFPLIVKHMGPYSFLIFLGFCFCCGLFVWLNVPETKNRTALEITEEFRKMHTKALKQDEKQGHDKIQMVKCTHL